MFMDDMMAHVGIAICLAYSWVDNDVPTFLYLDNGVNHDTQDIIDKYV